MKKGCRYATAKRGAIKHGFHVLKGAMPPLISKIPNSSTKRMAADTRGRSRATLLQNNLVRKVAERKFPGFFFDFSSRILPRIFLRIFPEFFEDFSCFVSWETETRKKFTKNPRHFSMQNSQANTKKTFTKCFWRAGKVAKQGHKRPFSTMAGCPKTAH